MNSASAHETPPDGICPPRQGMSFWDVVAPRGLRLSERLDRADAEIIPAAGEVLFQLGLTVAIPLLLAVVIESWL